MSSSGSKLSFPGAAGEVTGSCYLFDARGVKFLVDCGMFQGGKDGQRKNRRFAFDLRDRGRARSALMTAG